MQQKGVMREKLGPGVLSLQEIASQSIAHHLKDLKIICWKYRQHSTQPVDLSLILPILSLIAARMTPDIMITLECVCPDLCNDQHVDRAYWRAWVMRNYQSRLVLFPFPDLVNYVHELKRLLFLSTDNDHQLAVIELLQRIPFSIDLAKHTDIAREVNTIGKQTLFPDVKDSARKLTTKWKEIYERLQKTQEHNTSSIRSPPDVGLSDSSQANQVINSSSGSSSTLDPSRDSPAITTWKRLYFYSEKETTLQFARATSKASKMAEALKIEKRGSLSSISVSEEKDEVKKKRLAQTISTLKMPSKKVRRSEAVEIRMKPPPLVPLHKQKVERGQGR